MFAGDGDDNAGMGFLKDRLGLLRSRSLAFPLFQLVPEANHDGRCGRNRQNVRNRRGPEDAGHAPKDGSYDRKDDQQYAEWTAARRLLHGRWIAGRWRKPFERR